jgi:hypothetical protein
MSIVNVTDGTAVVSSSPASTTPAAVTFSRFFRILNFGSQGLESLVFG